jgi:hypothetical protein
MSKLLILSLVSACATSTSPIEPGSPIQDEAKACQPSAEVLFQIEHKTDTPEHHATSVFRLYSSGYWFFGDKQPGGKPGKQLEGCAATDQLGSITTKLDSVPWTATRSELACMAYSAQFVAYEVAGRHVWTERMCGSEQLDEASQKVIVDLRTLADQLVPKA